MAGCFPGASPGANLPKIAQDRRLVGVPHVLPSIEAGVVVAPLLLEPPSIHQFCPDFRSEI